MNEQVCPQCGKVHPRLEPTGMFAEGDEAPDLQMIVNAITNAKQALDPRTIPADATQDQVTKFTIANQRVLAGYQVLEREWWDKAIAKYTVLADGREYTLNFATREFMRALPHG